MVGPERLTLGHGLDLGHDLRFEGRLVGQQAKRPSETLGRGLVARRDEGQQIVGDLGIVEAAPGLGVSRGQQ